ncbi:hypothetical protein H2198_004796 [Neophaeococcomyces mojaviensis]|uniref:Uncharacterized protein n=1 Tax=Neophaeococcomyces mojaviensis TaxID=3383035 RepID=A0ACC3A7J8_9EURO|nr:hypothetical protein H2198_004796 [Knufia sp. JES_112]
MSRLVHLSAASKDTKRGARHYSVLKNVSFQRSILSSPVPSTQCRIDKNHSKIDIQSRQYSHSAAALRTVEPSHDEGKKGHQQGSRLDLGVFNGPVHEHKNTGFFGSRIWRLIAATRLPRAFFRDLNKVRQLAVPDKEPKQSHRIETSRVASKPSHTNPAKTSEIIGQSFVEYQGLWSLEAYLAKHGTKESTDIARLSESFSDSPGAEGMEDETQTSQDIRQMMDRPATVGVSDWISRRKELNTSDPLRSKWYNVHYLKGHGRSRRLTKRFTQHVYDQIGADADISDEALAVLLNECEVSLTQQDLTKCLDMLNWSWILLADGSLAIKRLVALAASENKESAQTVPLWVILQILQAERIDAESLHLLLYYIARHESDWTFWHGDAAMLLTVRLLRHARRSAPSCYEPITNLFLELSRTIFDGEASRVDPGKLARWCNRVLNLIAIPASIDPYRSMVSQQTSQLEIVRYIQERVPQIPLSREGYRALAKLQLMHTKTDAERDWARAKALTWPPFQKQHRMGGFINVDHPGRKSRVMKVFQRMQEAGYSRHEFDIAAQILAGWDTDSTPTIQTRTSARSIQVRRLWEPGSKYNELDSSPIIWAARVEATRTVREAWMCFCAYNDKMKEKAQSPRVYHAMFKKLLAMPKVYSERGTLPGDGRETFPDSDLPRDLVYIPEEIPSIQELYSRMLNQGVRPQGSFLADLLTQAPSLEQGLQYIRDAQISEDTKRVLTEPGSCSSALVAEVLPKLPSLILRSYVAFLASPYASIPEDWHRLRRPGNMIRGIRGHPFPGLSTAKALLVIAQTTDMSVWNAYLKALAKHTNTSNKQLRRLDLESIWTQTTNTLLYLRNTSKPDFTTFDPVMDIGYRLQTWARRNIEPAPWPVRIMKRLFIQAATGTERPDPKNWHSFCRKAEKVEVLHSVPRGDNVESMVWLLASGNAQDQVSDILDLLFWLNKNRDQITSNGRHITKHNMCAFRAYLEGWWAEELFPSEAEPVEFVSASPEQLEEARGLAQPFGWPSDETVLWYLRSRRAGFQRLLTKLKLLQDSQ